VHAAPKALISELGAVFGADQDLTNVHAVLTAQHASDDLVNLGPDIEKEKDRCLEVFMAWGHAMQQHLHGAHGSWTDFFDPCSGLPVRGHNPRGFHASHRWPSPGEVVSSRDAGGGYVSVSVSVPLWPCLHLSVAFHRLSSPPSTPSLHTLPGLRCVEHHLQRSGRFRAPPGVQDRRRGRLQGRAAPDVVDRVLPSHARHQRLPGTNRRGAGGRGRIGERGGRCEGMTATAALKKRAQNMCVCVWSVCGVCKIHALARARACVCVALNQSWS